MNASEKKWNDIYTYKTLAYENIDPYCRDMVNHRAHDKWAESVCYRTYPGKYFFYLDKFINTNGDVKAPKGLRAKVLECGNNHEIYVCVNNKWISWDDFDWDVD